MKKRWEVFWLAEVGIILIYILLCLAAGRVLIAAGAAAAAVSVWWSLYYFTAHYTLSNNVVEITSGIIFRRHRSIPLSNILWEMRLTSPFFRGSVMSHIFNLKILSSAENKFTVFVVSCKVACSVN